MKMATPFLKVYDAFLARITADEWTLEEELAIVERDWQELLKMAIARFKYPRVSLEMKHEWVKRCVASWEHIGQLYTSKDFSAANHLDKLNDLQAATLKEVEEQQDIYDRSRGKTPATIFRKLAGKKQYSRSDL